MMEKLCHPPVYIPPPPAATAVPVGGVAILKTSHRTWTGTVVFRDLLPSRTLGGTWGTSCIAAEPREVSVHRSPEEQRVEVGTDKAS